MGYFFEGTTLSGGSGGGGDSANISLSNLNSAGNGRFDAKANIGLNNLSSGGQMIIDSANGTISNCILEIPQNLKLTLENNVLTLKAGSTITLTGSIYTTFTTTSDNSRTYSPISSQRNKRNYVFCSFTGSLSNLYPMDQVKSGSTSSRPETAVNGEVFFDTDEKSFYQYNNGWTTWNVVYPLCMIDVDENGVMSFAKDSNGRDMIFNGAGFIGTTLFVYPNIKHLYARGFNDNGTLKSVSHTMNALLLRTFDTDVDSLYAIGEPASIGAGPFIYDKDTNYLYFISVSESNKVLSRTIAGHIKIVSGIVTDFTILQPYEGARYLLTDEIEEEVATKQADVTTLTGYDATKTQTLKNVNGVLTWVDD